MGLIFLFSMLAAVANSVHSVATKYVVRPGGLPSFPATFLLQVLAGTAAATCILVTGIRPVPAAMPYALGVVFVALTGFLLMILSFSLEDASVVGAVLGLKVIFLAFLESAYYGHSVKTGVWLGSALSVAGIALVTQTDRWTLRLRDLLRPGVLLMAASAFVFSVSDLFLKQTLTHWHGKSFGVSAYIVSMMGLVSLLILLAARLPAFRRTPLGAPWDWGMLCGVLSPLLISGILLYGYQFLFFTAFALSAQLTLVNILYNVRVLLVVALMALLVLGRGSTVERAGWRAYAFRTAGALCITGAISLALFVK